MVTPDSDRNIEVSDVRWLVREVVSALLKTGDLRAVAEITWNVSKVIRKTPSVRASQLGRNAGVLARAVLLSACTQRLRIRPAPDFDEHSYLRMYPDVREGVQAGRLASGFAHYVRHGRLEARLRPRPATPQATRSAGLFVSQAVKPLFGTGPAPALFGVPARAAGKLVLRLEVLEGDIRFLIARGRRNRKLATAQVAGSIVRFEVAIRREPVDWALAIAPPGNTACRLRLVEFAFSPSGVPDAGDSADYADLLRSGLFDPAWYARQVENVPAEYAFDHFFFVGRQSGLRPCFYCDRDWYLQTNADVRRSGIDPLLHYIRFGEREGRAPGPLFDPTWYAQRYAFESDRGLALADYLLRRGDARQPCADFDVQFYLQNNADVREAGIDPVEHYALWGYRENRDPSPQFHTRLYVQRYLNGSYDQNPLVHYLQHGRPAGLPLSGQDGPHRGIAGEIKKYAAPGPDFEEWQAPRRGGRHPEARVIAFYLPQFHRIPENDEWWGTGFTEWTNLSRGVPRCRGHHQPRIPRDLGFYDLSQPEPMRRQVELAKAAGLYGFCFYFYWFNQKRLLERPLDAFVQDPSLDFPFCLLWGNENWTRRWDGLESEILMEQRYDPHHDESLVATLASYFRQPRYIRAGTRPIFIIYRADQVPDGKARFAAWRALWREQYDLDPLFLMAQSFDNIDPTRYGLDGAIEFPPHQHIRRCNPVPFSQLEILDAGFSGTFYKYEDLARAGMTPVETTFPLMKTVAPSWDNDARRQGSGNVFLGSRPALYEQWLRSAIRHAHSHPVAGESIVFVNAWNEWAEGTYLEPDVHFGAAYLNATARAIYNLAEQDASSRILLVGHDAHRYGAQALLLAMARTFTRQFGMKVTVLLLDGGPLLEDLRSICRTIVVPKGDHERAALLSGLAGEGYHTAILNTTVTGTLAPRIAQAGIRFITLIHELPRFVAERGLESQARLIAKHAHAAVFAHGTVRDGFARTVGKCDAAMIVRPQGNYNLHEPAPDARETLRARLGIDPKARIVLNVGSGDLRKGFDLFVAAARQAVPERDDVHFVWLGKIESEIGLWLMPAADDRVLGGRFHHLPFAQEPQAVMNVIGGADLFVLSSREDPYPTVLMEAFAAGLDLLAYDGAGGFTDFVRANGTLLERSDAGTTAAAINELLARTSARRIFDQRQERRHIVENEMSHDRYCADLLTVLDTQLQRVSVIVPNYNYGHHLRGRLASIFEQSYPVFEIIVLDDASTDDSLDVVASVCAEYQREIKLITADTNSGSAFRQWRKGLDAVRGEYVWIAEADDVADPLFLGTLMRKLLESEAAFAFSDSWQIDEHDVRIGDSYAAYCNNGSRNGRFNRDFVLPGRDFLSEGLAVKNTILNVSAVVWRREAIDLALKSVGASLEEYRVAGDWRLYAQTALTNAPIAYVAEPLNGHRRHSASITHALDRRRHLDEIVGLHRLIEQMLQLAPTTVKDMKDYELEIAQQFGLESERG